jgi:predicted ester cyclase
MSFAQNKRSIEVFVEEFFNKGNYGVKDQLFAPGFVDHTPMFGLPGNAMGLEQAVRTLRAAFPDQRTKVDEILPIGEDAAVARFTIEATHNGPFGGMPPTGRHAVYSGIALARYAGDGTCKELWIYRDDVELFNQLGLLPRMTAPGVTEQPSPSAR